MVITQTSARQAVHRLEAVKRRIANIREKAEETTEQLVGTVETAGAAFLMGVINGKTGGASVLNVPVSLGAGLALTGFALLGGAGSSSHHLANAGAGCLAAFAVNEGRKLGNKSRTGNARSAIAASGELAIGAATPSTNFDFQTAAAMAAVPR